MGGHRIGYKIYIYNKGKKTKQPQPKEDGAYEFTNATTLTRKGYINYVVVFFKSKTWYQYVKYMSKVRFCVGYHIGWNYIIGVIKIIDYVVYYRGKMRPW